MSVQLNVTSGERKKRIMAPSVPIIILQQSKMNIKEEKVIISVYCKDIKILYALSLPKMHSFCFQSWVSSTRTRGSVRRRNPF
mmetsp:Transcript_17070/g.25883  ORF Transcript_17070/g.25883 Transcript_17070/m.25883 type:complete len:83 (+) Transcript_17070:2946-3194(+)